MAYGEGEGYRFHGRIVGEKEFKLVKVYKANKILKLPFCPIEGGSQGGLLSG